MAGSSAGQIDLDLRLNQSGFDRQLKSVTGMAKKAGGILAAAFAVKKLVDFGKECIELGSNLQEVQNVVDVTFTSMSAQVDKFAKDAATSFGLSETMAKKYTGTFGAMAKAFGFTESAAYDMGTTLTGLAGDVASFYNISQDEAYTKLKSVFTGETETLKDLGVVMTQNALDAYALANGYGKTTQAMSEAEKVALRYAFVQSQLTAASGDFARTSDSWANQVRILSLQFDSLKATIGQGLINLFTPIIKVINTVIGKLITLANAFKAFTELITGKKSGVTQVSGAGEAAKESLSGAAGAADNLAGATTGAGKAAKKAAKEMKALIGFDEVNKLSDQSQDSDSSGGGSGGAGGGAMDFGSLETGETVIENTDKSVSKLIERVKELAGLFKQGFDISFGDSQKNIETITKSVKSIRDSLRDIFTSKEVIDAVNKWADAVALNMGKMVGAVANVSIAIATNLTAGIAKSLEEKKEYIKSKIASLFEIGAKSWNISGDFFSALGDIISSALTSDSAINITADICSILTTGVLGGAELFAKAGLDLTKFIVQPIIDNKGKIKTAIENTLKPISTSVGTLKMVVEDAFAIMGRVYDNHIAPMFDTFKKGVSNTFGKVLDAYNTHIAPVLDNLATKFRSVYEEHLRPCLEKIGELFGKVAGAISLFYQGVIKPMVDWCIENIIPVLGPIFETIGGTIMGVFGAIGDIIGGLVDILGGVIDFITGIFTGDWGKAWCGIKDIFQGAADVIAGIWEGIKSFFSGAWEFLKGIFGPIAEWFKERFETAYTNATSAFAAIGEYFSEKWEAVKGFLAGVPDWFNEKFNSACEKVKSAFSNIGEYFSGKWNDIKGFFASVPDWFKEKFDGAMTKVKEAFSGIGDYFGGLWDDIKQRFSTIGSDIGDAIGGAFRSVVNGVMETIEGTINTGIGYINGAIGLINKLLPVRIGRIGEVTLPRLAQGGYVKANTPQLAMIGDNRHQGEVVAPEDKLRQMAMDAVQMAGGGGGFSTEALKVLREILQLLRELDLNIVVDGKKLKDIIVTKINQNTAATGVCEILT